jgi:hypothetical protein
VENGCLLCGVCSVTLPAARVVALGGVEQAVVHLWRAATMHRGPHRLTGHLCPPCADSFDSVGSWGPSLIEEAVLADLEATDRRQQATDLRRRLAGEDAPLLTAYATLVHRAVKAGRAVPPGSARSWGHLPSKLRG